MSFWYYKYLFLATEKMIQVNYISKIYPPVWPKSCEKHKFVSLLLLDINAYFFNKGIQRLFSVKYLLIRKKK